MGTGLFFEAMLTKLKTHHVFGSKLSMKQVYNFTDQFVGIERFIEVLELKDS